MSIRKPGKPPQAASRPTASRRVSQRVSSQHEAITLSVPEAGKRYFGLSRNGSYAAAERGDLPTVRVGKLLRVPVHVLERRLEAAR